MDIIEGMLPPVIIDNKNDEKFLDKGYFKFKSFIKKIN